jgi:hypothetical protein
MTWWMAVAAAGVVGIATWLYWRVECEQRQQETWIRQQQVRRLPRTRIFVAQLSEGTRPPTPPSC